MGKQALNIFPDQIFFQQYAVFAGSEIVCAVFFGAEPHVLVQRQGWFVVRRHGEEDLGRAGLGQGVQGVAQQALAQALLSVLGPDSETEDPCPARIGLFQGCRHIALRAFALDGNKGSGAKQDGNHLDKIRTVAAVKTLCLDGQQVLVVVGLQCADMRHVITPSSSLYTIAKKICFGEKAGPGICACPFLWYNGVTREGGVIICKLLAVDIDGTLLNRELKLTRHTRAAIALARRNGIGVTLATGRSFHSARRYANMLALDLPLICANGAFIAFRDGRVVQETALPARVALLLREMEAAGLFVQAFHRRGLYTTGRKSYLAGWIEEFCADDCKLSLLAYGIGEFRRCAVRRNPRLAEQVEAGAVTVHKLFCGGTEQRLAPFARRAREMGFSVELYPGTPQRMYLEIMPRGVSKGRGLRAVAQHLGIAMEETAAVGDNANDLDMIRAAGLGVAMGNAHETLKAAADYVTLSNDEDGVARWLDAHARCAAQTQGGV